MKSWSFTVFIGFEVLKRNKRESQNFCYCFSSQESGFQSRNLLYIFCFPTVCNVGSQNLFIFLNSCLLHTDKYLILYFYKLCTGSNVGNTSHSMDYFCHVCHRRQNGIKWHFLINFWLLELSLCDHSRLKSQEKKQRSLCFGDATTWVQLKTHTLETLATNTPRPWYIIIKYSINVTAIR